MIQVHCHGIGIRKWPCTGCSGAWARRTARMVLDWVFRCIDIQKYTFTMRINIPSSRLFVPHLSGNVYLACQPSSLCQPTSFLVRSSVFHCSPHRLHLSSVAISVALSTYGQVQNFFSSCFQSSISFTLTLSIIISSDSEHCSTQPGNF